MASGPKVGTWPVVNADRKASISVPWSESQPPRTGRLTSLRMAAAKTIAPRQASSRPDAPSCLMSMAEVGCQISGAAATSVEICAVTATSKSTASGQRQRHLLGQ